MKSSRSREKEILDKYANISDEHKAQAAFVVSRQEAEDFINQCKIDDVIDEKKLMVNLVLRLLHHYVAIEVMGAKKAKEFQRKASNYVELIGKLNSKEENIHDVSR